MAAKKTLKADSETISTVVPSVTESTTPSTDPSILSITDIQNSIRVIDYAAEQGAFKGWSTIEQVLLVRNRLNDFLKAVAPAQTDTPAA
jgi:hypothetical protein